MLDQLLLFFSIAGKFEEEINEVAMTEEGEADKETFTNSRDLGCRNDTMLLQELIPRQPLF